MNSCDMLSPWWFLRMDSASRLSTFRMTSLSPACSLLCSGMGNAFVMMIFSIHSQLYISSRQSPPKRPWVAMQYTFLAPPRLTTVSAAAIQDADLSIMSSTMNTGLSLTLPTRVTIVSISGFWRSSSSSSDEAAASYVPPRAWPCSLSRFSLLEEVVDMNEFIMCGGMSSFSPSDGGRARQELVCDVAEMEGEGCVSSTM